MSGKSSRRKGRFGERGGDFLHDLIDVFDEAHIEHLIAFIEDEIAGLSERIDDLPFDQIIEPAWGSDDDLGFGPKFP
jgi:hypothetical protein